MTAARFKGRGLAAGLLEQTLRSMQGLGYREAFAVITAGNAPSEGLFGQAGFVLRPEPE
jgi:L-amino acid N-acyltransferase YncA